MVGVTPEHLAFQLLLAAIGKAKNSLLGRPAEEQLFTLSGMSGRAFRDLSRLILNKQADEQPDTSESDIDGNTKER